MDATEEPELGNRFEVRGYPTLKVFRHGTPTEYEGPRDAAGIVAYMRKQAGPSAKVLGSKADLEKFIAGEEASVVHFGSSADFRKAADRKRNTHRFGEVVSPSVIAEAGRRDGETYIFQATRFVSKFDAPSVKYEGSSFDGAEFDAFVAANELPLVAERTADNADKFFSKNLPVVTVYAKVDYEMDPKGTNYIANRVRRVASNYRGKLVFCIASKDKFRGEVSDLGFPSSAAVAVAVLNGKDKFKMDAEWSVEALEQFIKNYVDGKVPKHIKSEEVYF